MKLRNRVREALDSRLGELRPTDRYHAPPKGWIRAIRDALGMTRPQLARRMGITSQSVQAMEKSEGAARIQIETLRRAADALDCNLVYALVPRQGLQHVVEERARKIALNQLSRVSHTMAMEDQAVDNDDLEMRISDFVESSLRERNIWDDV